MIDPKDVSTQAELRLSEALQCLCNISWPRSTLYILRAHDVCVSAHIPISAEDHVDLLLKVICSPLEAEVDVV